MATINSLGNRSISNFSSNNILQGYTTTVTAAGTTTLTVSSTEQQFFTGSTTQTIVLPVASTLTLGLNFRIVNNSTGTLTVNSSGGNLVQSMASLSSANITSILTSGTSAASWNVSYISLAGAATGITGGLANNILYQTAPSTTGFITSANSSILITSATGVPSLATLVPVVNMPIDNSTITPLANALLLPSQVGSPIAAGTDPEGITSFTIGTTYYVAVVNGGSNSFITYSWNGTTFVPLGSPVSTGSGPFKIVSYVIAGTQYISTSNFSANTFSTFAWSGSAFVSVGADVATGSGPRGITAYTIAGTQYISTSNYTATTFSTFAWSGSAFVSVGADVASGSSPFSITSYNISGTAYISISNFTASTFTTFAWSGSAFVSIGAAVATGSFPITINQYVISGTQYIFTGNNSGNSVSIFAWSGSAFVSIGSAVAASASPRGLAIYTVGSNILMSVACFGSDIMRTFIWNGTTFIEEVSTVATGTEPVAITTFIISNITYLGVACPTSNNWYLYTILPGSIRVSPTYNAPTATSLAGGTANYIPYQSASGVTGFLTPSTSGFVLTSNGTGSAPSFQAAGGGGVSWIDQTTTSVTMAINKAYSANNAGLVTLTLPATAVFGSIVQVSGNGAGGWLIAQNSGQTIHFGAVNTTTGGGGSLASTSRYDQVTLVCSVANTDWVVNSSLGMITYV